MPGRWKFISGRGIYLQSIPALGRTPTEPAITLAKAAAALEACEATWWITYGTLLGWVREGRFLSHDNDIDLAVSYGVDAVRLASLLAEYGFAQEAEWAGARGVTQQKFHYGNISTDIYYVTREGAFDMDEYRVGGRHDPRSYARAGHPVTGLTTMKVGDIYVPAPADPDRYLSHLYGPDWRTPVLDWDWRFSPPNCQIYCHRAEVVPMVFRYWKWKLRQRRATKA